MLPYSLGKLAIEFKVQQQKTIFPYEYASEVNLNFIGKCPSFNVFPKGYLPFPSCEVC